MCLFTCVCLTNGKQTALSNNMCPYLLPTQTAGDDAVHSRALLARGRLPNRPDQRAELDRPVAAHAKDDGEHFLSAVADRVRQTESESHDPSIIQAGHFNQR